MRKATKRLVMASITVLIVFLSFVTATYAWMVSSNTVDVGISFSSSKTDNYWFSLDGTSWVKTFTGEDVYKQLEKTYPENKSLFYETINTGSVANPVYVKDYKYTYRLLTPLATETGFVSRFYSMEHTVIEDKVAFVFHNKTDDYADDGSVVRNSYDPNNGFIKFNLKVKSDIDSYIYLNDYNVMVNGVASPNDYSSTSLLRIGFESDLYNVSKHDDGTSNDFYIQNEYVEEDGVKTNLSKHIKILEPVKKLADSLAQYMGGKKYLTNSFGVGKYFSTDYIDDFAYDMRKPHSLLIRNKGNNAFIFNKDYVNVYGTDIDKIYDFKYINDVIKNKLNDNELYSVDSENNVSGTPILRLSKGKVEELTVYIWLEGWDGAACDFSQLGSFSLSLSFIENKR